MNITFRENTTDSITIYNDNQKIVVISNSTNEVSTFNFLPNIPITIELKSGPSALPVFKVPQVNLTTGAPNITNIIKVDLTDKNPVFALDLSMYVGKYYNVSVPDGYTLDVSMAYDENKGDEYKNFDLYDGQHYVGK